MSAGAPEPDPGSRRLRILHVSEVHWGGVVTLLEHFVREQLAEGHDVHVLAPGGLPDVGGARHRWSLSRTRPWSMVRALRELRTVVATLRPDVLHVHSFVAGLLVRLPVVGVDRGAAGIVYQPHAWSFDLVGLRLFGFALRRWETFASHRTDVLVANCDDEIAEGRAMGVTTPGHVLGVAVDTRRFRPVTDPERAALRAELGLGSQWVALCLGRLARQKGLDLLVPAWEERHPEGCELVLVGPGDPDPLQQLAPRQWGRSVSWRGERHDAERWLAAADVLVLPSRYETVAVVVAEAMACGTPVVTTRFNGAEETVEAGPLDPGGAVVDLGDMRGLICELQRRLGDAELRTGEALAARTRAVELFRPDAVAARLETAYVQAVALAGIRTRGESA